ncbi:MAG: hypothetical protein HY909_00835 [Deltaproteobacteria bacterium]|nr:hypothetical protein [Deltaproteobacteria bacterium]
MRAALAALLGLLGACSSAPVAQPGARWAERPRPSPAAWERLYPREFPGPYGDVAALSQGEAVVVSGEGLWRVGAQGPAERVCLGADGATIQAVQADGDRFLALGLHEGEPSVWSSPDRGRSCHLSVLPAPARRIFLRGEVALAWGPPDGLLRSMDGGLHWEALPALVGVSELALGPSGALYAAVSLGLHSDRVRWFQLFPNGTEAWTPSALGTRRGPSALRLRADGTALLGDALGTVTVDRAQGVTRGPTEALGLVQADRPVAFVEAGDARFIAMAERHFREVTAEGSRPLAALPGLRRPGYFDASEDGTLWATDPYAVWRRAPGGAMVTLASSDATELEPLALAVEGPHLAVVSRPGALATSHAGGAGFRRVRLPTALGLPSAVALTPSGVALVLGAGGLVVQQGEALVGVELPRRTGSAPGRATVAVLGDRWVVCDGDVYTSDDEGHHWEHRFGPSAGNPPQGARAIAAVVHPSGAVLVLDHERNLWSSPDAGTTFRRLERDQPIPSAHPGHWPGVPVLAWDGGRHLAVLNRYTFARSSDGGRTFTVSSAPFSPRAAFMTAEGRLLVVGEPPQGLPEGCASSATDASVAMEGSDAWRFPPDACATLAAAFTLGAGALYSVSTAGVLRRIATDRPWPPR